VAAPTLADAPGLAGTSTTYGTAQTVTIANPASGTNPVRVCYTDPSIAGSSGLSVDAATNACTAGLFGGVRCLANNALLAPGASFTVNITANYVLNARACSTNPFTPSDLTTRTYNFTPYAHTITLDGNDDFADANHLLAENSLPAQNGGPAITDNHAYLSWDANNLYFGFRGPAVTSDADRYFNVYIRSAGGTYTSQRDTVGGANRFGSGAGDDPANVVNGINWHFYLRTDRLEAAGASTFNGAWTDSAASAWACQTGGTLGQGDSYIECSLPRSTVGMTGANSILSFQGNISDTSASPNVVFPYVAAPKYWTGNLDIQIPSDPARIQ
jgi:hypothetical protein